MLLEYDHGFDDFPDALILSDFNHLPISGTYNSIPLLTYPDINGQYVFIPLDESTREYNFHISDYTNGQTGSGNSVTFMGIKDVESVRNDTRAAIIPIVILSQEIVRTPDNKPSYKADRLFIGAILNYPPSGGPHYDGVLGSLIMGRVTQYPIEAYLPESESLIGTTQLNYNLYLHRPSN